MIIETTDYITPTNFAKKVGYTRMQINRYIRHGAIPTIEIDGHLFVHKDQFFEKGFKRCDQTC
jgi:hypothetical protein